jgi:hypothetical protein
VKGQEQVVAQKLFVNGVARVLLTQTIVIVMEVFILHHPVIVEENLLREYAVL